TYFQFGRIRAVGPDLRVRRLQVQDRGQALFVEAIFGTSSGAVVEVGGYTDALIAGHQDGPVGYFLLHADGKLQRIQGIPLRAGSAAVAAPGSTRFSETFHHGVGSLVQPIDVHLRWKGARSATP